MLTADPHAAGDRKFILAEEKYNATNFLTLWDFEGVFKYSPLFYGWYTNRDSNIRGYRLPFAYFVTGLVVYAYSFFATLRKMAENSRMSKLSEKDDECIFSWKLFTAWDYMIGNAETAHNRVASIVMGFKEALLEEAEKKREARKWRVICFRVLVNTIVLGLLSFSAFAVIMVVKRSTEPEANLTVWRKNEITVVMSLITLFFPMLFEVLGLLEQYHPRKQLRLQLARIMVLNLLNLYSLIFALFDKISDMTTELQDFKNLTEIVSNIDPTLSLPTILTDPTTIQPYTNTNKCYEICTGVEETNSIKIASLIAALVYNVTTLSYPKIAQLITESYNNVEVSSEYFNTTTFLNDVTSTEFYNGTNNFTEFYKLDNNVTNYNDENSTDFNDLFVDYLTYVLCNFGNSSSCKYDWKNLNNSIPVPPNVTIEENFTSSSTFSEDFDLFKSTMSTIFNTTAPDFDERFDHELSSIYNEITTTISSTMENATGVSNCTWICDEIVYPINNSTTSLMAPMMENNLNYSARARLRTLCWETMFGQELLKLTVMDLIMTVLSTLLVDFIRGIFVRFMNRCWCWDLEKKFPQYGDFKVAENILHLVNNQGMVWMGMFFSPGLVILNVAKLYIMMYLRTWAVLTCNVPHEIIFRASRSNNFYYALLLMMLFLCVLPVGYAIVWIKPSWHCGPFSKYQKIFHIFTKTIRNTVPEPLQKPLDYIASPGIVIPLLVLLILIIYYLISLTGALREANVDLKVQLRRERTEERRKMFQLADRRRRVGSGGSGELSSNTPFTKWKKLLGNLPSKSFDDTPKYELEDPPAPIKEEKTENKSKDFFSKFIKKALGKSSTSEEEQNAEDGTDTEQHDSLPEDVNAAKDIKPQIHKPLRPSISSGSSDFQMAVGRAWSLKKNQNRTETDATEPGESIKHVQIQEIKPLKYSTILTRKDTFDLKKKTYKRRGFEAPSTSKDMRQDSESSVWSDNIPVIKISKTESAENILDESIRIKTVKSDSSSKEASPEVFKNKKVQAVEDPIEELKRFKPKIKCALKKQSTEIDEDTVCYFNKDLERNITERKAIEALAEEDFLPSDHSNDYSKVEEISPDKSSSEDTELKESSGDTILNSPFVVEFSNSVDTQKESNNVSPQTESSSEYKDTI